MSVAHDYSQMHCLVDRLRPDQLRRLLRLVERDPGFAVNSDETAKADRRDEADGLSRPAIVGIFDSGQGNLSEQVDEHTARRFNHPV
jgi:hypothetical protein